MEMYTTKKKIEYINGYYPATAYPHTMVGTENVILVRDLDKHKSSRCWILFTESRCYLQSYDTIVSCWTKEKGVEHFGKWSNTTSRQQTWFEREMTL